MKIGIYNRSWNRYGGGEKYIGAIAQYLSIYGSVDLIAHEPFSIPRLEKRLNLKLGHCNTIILDGPDDSIAEKISSEYDLWINITYHSQARSNAKRSILIIMFPFCGNKFLKYLWRALPVKQPTWLQKMLWKEHGFWHTYDTMLAISPYTQAWIEQWWDEKCQILLPPVELITYSPAQPKKNIILSVGRFFTGGHNKKQEVMIQNFKKVIDSGSCSGWEYHLCGGVHPEAAHQAYFKKIMETIKGYPIYIHPDIKRSELEDLYRDASIFWHASGFGEDEIRKPEEQEHFGITTVEAMSAGCIPVVIARGGQKQIMQNGVNGYLWDTLGELSRNTIKIMNNPAQAKIMREQAIKDAALYSYDVFVEKFSLILKQLIREA